MANVKIFDTTLRDGEETAGVVFAAREKLQIAKMLDQIGIGQIEAGIPIMGGDEEKAILDIVNSEHRASIMAWNRPRTEDIEASIKCGVDAIAISTSTSDTHIHHKLKSDRNQVLHEMVSAIGYAKNYGLYVSVSAEDASRSDFEYLCRFAQAVKDAGADRLRYCDTVGILDPFTTYERIKALREVVDIDIEIHAHNKFGMATANTIAAVKAGASYVSVTVNGLGERAGNAALEEVAMVLKYLFKYEVDLDTAKFSELSNYVAQASNREVPSWKAIVGTHMFAHSGRYFDSDFPQSYDIFDPRDVGLERQIIIGKHSTVGAIKQKFREYGTILSDKDAEELLAKVRESVVSLKRSLFDKELIYIYEDHLKNKK